MYQSASEPVSSSCCSSISAVVVIGRKLLTNKKRPVPLQDEAGQPVVPPCLAAWGGSLWLLDNGRAVSLDREISRRFGSERLPAGSHQAPALSNGGALVLFRRVGPTYHL